MKTTKTAYFFKILNHRNSGGFAYYVWPEDGEWTRRITHPLKMCRNGFHLLRPSGLQRFWQLWSHKYRNGFTIYLAEAETAGMLEDLTGTKKFCTRRARLVKKMKTYGQDPKDIFDDKESIGNWMDQNGIVLED